MIKGGAVEAASPFVGGRNLKTVIKAECKYLLTIEEAAAYFNLGVKRLTKLLGSPEGAELVLLVGVKRLVKRKKMENFLDKVMAI